MDIEDIVRTYKELNPQTPDELEKTFQCLRKKYRTNISKNLLNQHIQDSLLIKKAGRSRSGIINVSVVMKPDEFSCRYNCYFCPDERKKNGALIDMPRSYLSNEDAVSRASKVQFDPVDQIRVRLDQLQKNGHQLDKIEIRILGGTFSCYKHPYAKEFIRDIFYGVNIYGKKRRIPLSLQEEQQLNESNDIHIVGLGIETRPDEITPKEIVRFRSYGCTRVELGVQTIHNEILKRLNRGHTVEDSKKAVRLLKDAGLKCEIHIMIDLPFSTPGLDIECYDAVLGGEDLLPDYLKDYPCLDVPFTVIKKWKEIGKWKPYAESDFDQFKKVLLYRQSITRKMTRVNRTLRDFRKADEANGFLGYESDTIPSSIGDLIHREAEQKGIYCQCIRCCEVKTETFDIKDMNMDVQSFMASGQKEFFISAEIPRKNRPLLLGFLRLRFLPTSDNLIPELKGTEAIIRELHVYGNVLKVGKNSNRSSAQHLGIGRLLLKKAESICLKNGKNRIAVISGVGVRNYYKKFGYKLVDTYMMKHIIHPIIYILLFWIFYF